jgi:hypothetical protein
LGITGATSGGPMLDRMRRSMGIAAGLLTVLGAVVGVVIVMSGSDFGGRPPLEAITVNAPEDLPATPQHMDGAPAVPVPPSGLPRPPDASTIVPPPPAVTADVPAPPPPISPGDDGFDDDWGDDWGGDDDGDDD